MLSLPILLLAATAAASTPVAEDATLKVLTPPVVEIQDSRLVEAAKATNAARPGHEAKVAIDRLSLRRNMAVQAAPVVAGAEQVPLLNVDRARVDPLAVLQATLASSANVKLLHTPAEVAAEQKR